MLELFFSACGAGACVVLIMLILKDFYQSVAARAFLVLIFGAFAHLLIRWLPDNFSAYIFMITSATPAFFWISCRLIFQEGRPLPTYGLFLALYSFITPAVTKLLGIKPDPLWLEVMIRKIPQWLEYALIIMGVMALLRGRADDMVESRRRLRWAIMGAAGLSLGWSIFSFNFKFGSAASRIFAIDLSILIIIWFLFKGRTDIWGSSSALARKTEPLLEPISVTGAGSDADSDENVGDIVETEVFSGSVTPASQVEEVDSNALSALKQLMAEGFYRRENLTLKILAQEMRLPEYRVRAVINKELDYRNFNEFINEYRITEAAQRLVDEPETPISNIALDVGYRTLSSFNRAFRKEKNTTPTAYRE
ncbi:MAG: helix-turn-helix domain-containing protein [Oleispira sp.]|nr:helix-turn-helix domain-containing protein [Oleispira sp.]